MKKLLLATTAAAALTLGASAARAEIDLDLGGFFKGYAGYANQDEAPGTSNRDFSIKRKSQVYFTGETTLDNGLTVGFNSELIQENSQNNLAPNAIAAGSNNDAKTEESYLYMSGNWGRVNLGRENGAAYLLQVAAPAADSNIDGMDIDFSFVDLASATAFGQVDQDYQHSGPLNGQAGREAQYADKITYLTPKFNGFQAGVTYTPSYDSLNQSNYFGSQPGNLVGGFEHVMEGAVRYDGEYSGVGIHLGGGYTSAQQQIEIAGSDDYNEWNAGAKFTWEGFGFGGAYKSDNGGVGTGADHNDWTVGADYTYGAYTFGATYFNAEADDLGGSNELDRYTVGASYTYGPGMSFRGAVAYYDYDSVVAGGDNEAIVGTVGTDVQF